LVILDILTQTYQNLQISPNHKLIQYCSKILSNKKPLSRPETAKSKSQKSETHEEAEEPEVEGDKPKPPPELIPAGFLEEIMEQAELQEAENFGNTHDIELKKHWHNFDIYAKNTTRIQYDKTTVGHMLISAIKHVSRIDSDKNADPDRQNHDLTDLENMLRDGFKEADTSHIYDQPDVINVEAEKSIASASNIIEDHREAVS
jgi:hypothetical protein